MQNRVDPFGTVIETKARGLWMGNRGKIHNDKKEIVQAYKLKAWLTCKLQFNGRHRIVMGANTYTELFFLDEATAFAAGHRPCFECRRNDFVYFKKMWLKANPEFGFTESTSIQQIDAVLHKERMNDDGSKRTFEANINHLPDGSFISIDERAYLLYNHQLHLWTPFGYKTYKTKPASEIVTVLTPRSIVKMFKEGYVPQMSV